MELRPDRRTILAGAAALALPLAGCPSDDGEPTATGDQSTDGGGPANGLDLELGVTPLATGIGSPADVVTAPDGSVLIAEQPGRVVTVADGEVRPVLDVRDRVVDVSGYSERGLLGLAPHPNFGDNGRLFVRYSAPPREGTPGSYSHTFVLAEFPVDPDGLTGDPGAEQTILEIPEPQSNHNAGDLVFGPDGYLYVPVGDGGGAGDRGAGHVEDWYDAVPGGNGQDVTENLLGSLLRIDVDSDGDQPYGIPEDNPLVGEQGLDEHYAWGLRNPWGLSFGPDGRLFLADVGQNRFEEVNVVERGGNYGWNVREGTACYQATDCPTTTPDGQPLRSPIVAYGRDGPVSGVAVVGGYLYHGDALPALRGRYVFGDWQAEGRLFVASESGEGDWSTTAVPIAGGDPGQYLLSIGEDPEGELLLGTTTAGGVSADAGGVYRVTSA